MDTAEKPAIPTVLGTPFAGGFFAGLMFVGDKPCALIVAPKAEGEHKETTWNEDRKDVPGAQNYFYGFGNTNAMRDAGSDLGKWARDLKIGGHDDWYLPSRVEALILKGNESAMGELFAEGGAEAFERDWYWTSTQRAGAPDFAWYQSFGLGDQDCTWKDGNYIRARAVRSIPL